MTPLTTIDLLYFNAGGGHRASAEALQAVLRARRPAWQVRLVHLVEALDPQELLGRLDELRANVRRLDNRALFEVPEILGDVLQQASGVQRQATSSAQQSHVGHENARC